MVERLTTAWGVELLETGGKTLWAQVDQPASVVEELSVEQLLAQWDGPEAPAPSAGGITVSIEVDVQATLASRTHTDDLVRALQLTLLEKATPLTTGTPVMTEATRREVLDLAQPLDAAHEEFHGPRRQMWIQTLAAAREGLDRTNLRLDLQRGDAEAARRWLAALDHADALTAAGKLLLPPFPEAITAFRRYYIGAIIEQIDATPQRSWPL